jgi:LEA14-like dessication related protein
MRVFLALVALALFSSCGSWETPVLKSYDGLSEFSIKEKFLNVNLDGVIENPNSTTIYIHNLDTDVFVDGRKLGSLVIKERFKLQKKTSTQLSLPLIISLEKGAMFKLGMLALKDSANFVFKGKVIGGGRILKKSVPFEVERKLPTKSLILP